LCNNHVPSYQLAAETGFPPPLLVLLLLCCVLTACVGKQANDDDAVAWRRNDVGGARKMEAVGHWARSHSLRGDFSSHEI
jgi:hypothetical protein